jgi:hypothetical protein
MIIPRGPSYGHPDVGNVLADLLIAECDMAGLESGHEPFARAKIKSGM